MYMYMYMQTNSFEGLRMRLEGWGEAEGLGRESRIIWVEGGGLQLVCM